MDTIEKYRYGLRKTVSKHFKPGKSRQTYCSYCSREMLISKPIPNYYAGWQLINMEEALFP